MQVKIIHLGDIQVEIKTSGEMSQRLSEYDHVLKEISNMLKIEKPEILYIAGDIYQSNLTNGDETMWFTKFLKACIPHCQRIIIIPGNHDVKQFNNDIMDNGKVRNITDSIESVVFAIDNPKISYYKHTGYYTDTKFDITWSVWSQLDKWSAVEPKPAYNPYEQNLSKLTSSHITLYHDPIRNSVNFDGKVGFNTEQYKIDMSTFKAHTNTVLAGDIHNPQIHRDGDFIFTYCSSLVQRNFGEGDYYNDSKLYADGNSKHGYNKIIFDTDLDKVIDIEFVPIKPFVGRHTIQLSKDFNYDLCNTLSIDKHSFDYVRLVVHGNVNEYFKYAETIAEHLSSDSVHLDVEYAANAVLDTDNIDQINSIDELIGPAKITEIAHKYIDKNVDATKMLTDDLKSQAKELFKRIFAQEFAKIDMSSKYRSIKLLSADIENFMSLSHNVSINFNNYNFTRITGTNGGGKTTIYRFLSFMFTDFVSAGQSAKSQKQNYALYFNDRIDSDTAGGTIKFMVNDDLHVLTKTLTRTWKKNTPHYYEQNWQDHISGIDIRMSLTSSSLTSNDTKQILEYMSSIMTIDMFATSVCIDQTSLDNLIKQKSEELNQSILESIGLDFFNNMLEQYDVLRDTMMQKVTKPDLTIEDIVKSKASIELERPELLIRSESLLIEQTTIDHDIIQTEQKKSNQVLLLKNVREKTVIANDISSQVKKVDDITSDIRSTKQLILDKQLNLTTAKQTNVDLDNDILQKQRCILEHTQTITLANQSIVNLNKHIESSKSELTNISTIVRSEYDKQISDIQKQIDDIKLTIVTNTSKISKHRSSFDLRISNRKSELLSELTELTNTHLKLLSDYQEKLRRQDDIRSDIQRSNNTIAEYRIEVSNLEASTVCRECGREHTHDTKQQIQINIDAVHDKINTKVNQIITDTELVDSINVVLSGIQTEIELAHTAVTNKQTEIAINNASKFEDSTEYSESEILIQENAKHSEHIVALNASIDAISSGITTKLKSDQRVIDIVEKVTKYKSEIVDHQTVIDNTKSIIVPIELDIATCQSNKVDIVELEMLIQNLTTKLNNLNIELTSVESKIETLKIEAEHAISDELVKQKIAEIDELLVTYRSALSINANNQYNTKTSLDRIDERLAACDIDIQNVRKYQLVDSVLKLYKRLVSKNGLPQYIFEHLVPVINTKLNDLMDGMPYRLFFDNVDLNMCMIDLTKNVIRPVTFASGAETTFLGLALVSARQQLNVSTQFNVLLLDELSGKLNKGEDLTYSAIDFQKVFTKMISRMSKSIKIMIVDHVVNHYQCDRILEVQKTDSGSIVVSTNVTRQQESSELQN